MIDLRIVETFVEIELIISSVNLNSTLLSMVCSFDLASFFTSFKV